MRSKFSTAETSLGAIDTTANYHQEKVKDEMVATRLVDSFTLTRAITIKSTRLDLVGKAAGLVTELIEDGHRIVSRAPEFHYTRLGELKIVMAGEASSNAYQRAEQVVQNSNCRILSVRNARVGVMQVTRPESSEVTDSGVLDTSTVEKDVTSVVTLNLLIAPGPRP